MRGLTTDDLERCIRLSAQAVANIDRGVSAWRLIVARDRMLSAFGIGDG